jgi:hypothetical protein
VLDAYEEEVRKLSYAAEVFRPIEFDPVKFHLALQCRGLRDDLGLPPPPDDDPLDRDTEEWDAEVVGLQRYERMSMHLRKMCEREGHRERKREKERERAGCKRAR